MNYHTCLRVRLFRSRAGNFVSVSLLIPIIVLQLLMIDRDLFTIWLATEVKHFSSIFDQIYLEPDNVLHFGSNNKMMKYKTDDNIFEDNDNYGKDKISGFSNFTMLDLNQ
uniref:Uncharacterized protein n=1 Tax=Romanomermis culicivorax TaxID=13658 RepID=A0A915J6T6_ROMCU